MHNRILPVIALLLVSCSASPGTMNHSGMGHDMKQPEIKENNVDTSTLTEASAPQILEVKNGDTIDLNPQMMKKTLDGATFQIYAYNGQFPGPILKVAQGSTFTVRVKNEIDQPTTVHWHGIRLRNKFDGAAGVTQEAIEPGDSFTYTVTVPDAGIYWYHPHVREDLQQDMGLYGALWVTPEDDAAYPPVNHEEVIFLDDMLLGDDGTPIPHGKTEANFALMGRFGNTTIINGVSAYTYGFGTNRGVTRLYLINAANTRTFRVGVSNAHTESTVKMKLIGSDNGPYEREQLVDSVTLAPSERAIVDVLFDEATTYYLEHRSGSRDSGFGLGTIIVSDEDASPSYAGTFPTLGTHADIVEREDVKRYLAAEPEHSMHLSVEQKMMGGMMMMDHGTEEDGIEWEDPMPMMNAMATKGNTQWKLIDEETGAENMDIAYKFGVGDKVKIRIVNDTAEDGSDHAMQHPIHFHGQRFLVLAVDGKPNENLVWKDTVLVPKDAVVDILLDVTNPGDWMIHCHIAEHLSNGMMGLFSVE